jgi:probable HAF family extracellular repeat protein
MTPRVRMTALAICLLVSLPLAQPSAAQPQERVALGSPGDCQWSAARRVNARGDAVGQCVRPSGQLAAVLWRDGETVDLGFYGGHASDINNRGQIVGYGWTTCCAVRAFLWEDGRLTDLGDLGGAESQALAINESGQIVGGSTTAAGEGHAFLWDKGRMTNLGTLDGIYSTATDINDGGEVVGSSGDHAFLWKNGTMTDLGVFEPGGGFTTPWAINNAGHVVGQCGTLVEEHACFWDGASWIDLGTAEPAPPEGYDFTSTASDINNRGQIVGLSSSLSGLNQPLLWEDGVMTILNTDGAGGSALGINERGQIVGHVSGLGAVMWFRP